MNQSSAALNYWTAPGQTGVNPKPVAGNSSNSNDFTTDRWLQDGSYVRFKELTLAYSLPQKALDKMRIKGLRFYLSGQNLYTFSDVDAFDPEMGATGTVTSIYPYTKSFVGGIELTF